MNEPCTSQELIAHCLFGGIADKRKLLKDERMNHLVRFSTAKQMKHVIARAIACSIMLLVLPSCGIPPLRHPQPGPGVPVDFNGGPARITQLSSESKSFTMIECLRT